MFNLRTRANTTNSRMVLNSAIQYNKSIYNVHKVSRGAESEARCKQSKVGRKKDLRPEKDGEYIAFLCS